jgi:tetratricopeptide (TPR) repeat protein
MIHHLRARSGHCLLAASAALGLSLWTTAAFGQQNALRRGPALQLAPDDGPQLEPIGAQSDAGQNGGPTLAEPKPTSKSQPRRWRRSSAATSSEQDSEPAETAPPKRSTPREIATQLPELGLPAAPRREEEPVVEQKSKESGKESNKESGEEPGKPLVLEAYNKSRSAKDDATLSETIDLCRDGLQAGLNSAASEYARQLMSWAHNRRGEIHAAAGRDSQAFDDFDAAVELDAKSWRALHNRGVSYAVLGKSDKAMADFNQSIEVNKEFPIAYFNRAETRYEAGDYQAALGDYDQAIKLLPTDGAALNSRGHTHFRLGNFKQAINDFNATLKVDPKSAAALLNRGDVYAAMGNHGAAAHDYDAAIRMRPDLGRAHQSMAWLLATCPDPRFRNASQAITAAKLAIELDGDDDHRYLATLAAAMANAGRYEAAERIQRQAIRGTPTKLRPTQEKRLTLYRSHQPFRTGAQEMAAQPTNDREVRSARTNTSVRQASGYMR